jgi:hypothetical protein
MTRFGRRLNKMMDHYTRPVMTQQIISVMTETSFEFII